MYSEIIAEMPKIISQKILNDELYINCEVEENKYYEIALINQVMIGSVSGAELIDDSLHFFIPGEENKKTDHEIIIKMK